MNAAFASALNAAHDACAQQNYPAGSLYVVATPIGNLADITLRALHILRTADSIACEDTRHTRALLRSFGLEPLGRLLALHQHNEAEATPEVLRRLQSGQRVALVSDAGTPAISDPGGRLVAAVQAAGLRVSPVPGASSVTAVLSCAGLGLDSSGGFVFAGFLPPRASERASALQALAAAQQAVVMLEAPHRIEALAADLARLTPRRVTVGRELTKQFEELATLSCTELPAWLGADANRLRGEYVLVMHPPQADAPAAPQADEQLLRVLLTELPLKSAVKLASQLSPTPRNTLYALALRIQSDADTAG